MRPEWVGKSLVELNLRRKYGINVIALQQNGKVMTDIDPNLVFRDDMKMIVLANNQKFKQLG